MSFAERFPYVVIAAIFFALAAAAVIAEVSYLHAAGFVTVLG